MSKYYYQTGGGQEFVDYTTAWQPNYEFLARALTKRQTEYDRGFEAVRNIYTTALSKPVTSQANELYRQEAIKKAQSAIKSISGLDLSNPANVRDAQGIFDPIVNDQKIAYDMQITQMHQNEKQKLEAARNSTNEKIRETYNPSSLQAINLVEDELRNTGREGDSIFKIRPQKFIAYQDPIKELDKLAKDAGLEIEIDNSQGGYIIKTTNGPMTIPQFTNWAKLRLGSQYDEQFAQEAFVKTESQIRSVMKEQNLSRNEAIRNISAEISQDLFGESDEELDASDKTLKQINDEIETFEENHPDGGNTPVLKQQYQNLLDERDKLKNDFAQKTTSNSSLKNEGIDYISQNLTNLVASSLKSNIAKNWATAYATTKMKYEIRPDEVVLKKWTLAQDERHHQQDLAFRQQQEANEQARFEKKYALDVAKLEQDAAIAKAKGELPSTDEVGTFTTNERMAGTDVISESLSKNKNELFNLAFGAGNGLMNAITSIGGKNHGTYYPVLSKVKQIAESGQGSLNDNDKTQIILLATKLGLDPKRLKSIDNNSANAQSLLNNLISGVYSKAKEHVSYNMKQGKVSKVSGMAEVFTKTLASMTSLMGQRDNLNSNYKKIAQEIAPNGVVKPMYKDVKIMYYLSDGTPVYDVSSLDAAKKQHLSNVIDKGYSNRAGAVGKKYSITGLSDAEVIQLTNPDFVTTIETDDEGDANFTVDRLNKLSGDAKRKLFSNGVIGGFDPSSKTAYFEIKVDPSSTVAKELGIKAQKTLKLKVPYDRLSNSSLNRLSSLARENSMNTTSAGPLEPLLTSFTSTVKASSHYNAYDFDYTVSGTYDESGKPGVNVNITWLNPASNKKETKTDFFSIKDPSNPANYTVVTNYIDNAFQNYMFQRDAFTP